MEEGTRFIFGEITLVLSGGQIEWAREMQGNYSLSIARVLVTDDNSLDREWKWIRFLEDKINRPW